MYKPTLPDLFPTGPGKPTPPDAYRYPDVYPPGASNEALQYDLEDAFDYTTQPGDWWRDLFDIAPEDQFGAPSIEGGPGNPIDYDAPWNVGPYQSWPMYDMHQPPSTFPPAEFPPRPFNPQPQMGPPRFDNPWDPPRQRDPGTGSDPTRLNPLTQPMMGPQSMQQMPGLEQFMQQQMMQVPYGQQFGPIAGHLVR